MTPRLLLLRNLTHFWRTNVAVMLGVVAATAVIGGALIVGDSVRESLRQMSLDRLADVDHALTGQRFFREDLATNWEAASQTAQIVAPALVMQGTIEFSTASRRAAPSTETAPPREDEGKTAPAQSRGGLVRAGHINVFGTDARLWGLLVPDQTGSQPVAPTGGEIVINRRVKEQLGLQIGDDISLIVEIPASIPRDALLGDREETVTELVLRVSEIVEDATGPGRFGLNPSQQLPLNVFVSLPELQSATGLAAVRRSRRHPIAKPARVNALFIATGPGDASDALSADVAETLTQELEEHISLSDLALRIVENETQGYLSLESEQMILEQSLADAAVDVANELQFQVSPVLVYLLNEIWNTKDPEQYSMYSVIAGIDVDPLSADSPFALPKSIASSEDAINPIPENQVVLNDWLAADIAVEPGDSIQVKYHVVGDRGDLPEEVQEFVVAGIVPLEAAAADPGLTPTVPGVTDAESYDDWREPFPLKRERITSRDDDYWDAHRTTPKLFMNLATAQSLWESKYGRVTSVRFAPSKGQSLSAVRDEFEDAFLDRLVPQQTGLLVQPIKQIGLQAAQGTTDFTGLFIGFSFFLILSATILVGLLFRLGIEQRISEFGLLTAVGFSPQRVRRLFLSEGALLVGIGGLLGVAASVGYAGVMIHGLKTWWYGAIGTRFLDLYVTSLSLLMGFAIAAVVAYLAVLWALRQTRGQSTRALLSGELTQIGRRADQTGRLTSLAAIITLGVSSLCLVLTVMGIIPETEAFSGFSWKVVMFFVVGIGMLAGSLTGLSAALTSNQTVPVRGSGTSGQLRLGLRNAARNRSRSVLTASLIASATFVIVAVAAGQINPANSAPDPRSGNGGFALVAETNVPILNDLNTRSGRSKLGFSVQDDAQNALLDSARVMPFRVRPGENASCLNLYQTQLPTVLGVPKDVLQAMVQENRFLFANTPGDHPWELLTKELASGHVPVLGDMNTLMYSLHKGIGSTIPVPRDADPQQRLEVAGMFANSVFQGVLLMSETNFESLFPEQVGFQYFLIEVSPDQSSAFSEVLEENLGDYGFDAEPVTDRLADFLAVQNTYLSTFQSLGGLGLLLGTIGLATVMLRNVLERRSELSLLRAIGFRKSQVALLVLWENAFLLTWGLVAGTASALLAMAPHLVSSGSDIPWPSILQLLSAVFVIGMLTAFMAVRAAVRTPILSTLRGE